MTKMVIVNPRLSLPLDLPYKKRQRPYFSNNALQQATVRYNEAIRKKYNDVQFAKRLENGSATQNETLGVNTIDISKMVDPTLFAEMSDMNPLTLVKKRKSKRFDGSPPGSANSADIGPSCSRSRHASTFIENVRLSNTNTSPADEPFLMQNNNSNSNYDCANNEILPHLKTVGTTEAEKSLEAQAMHEYEPTIDSAHDMIFGNVMGMDYGNYVHGPLWTPPQGCGNNIGSNETSPNFHNAPPGLCCPTKLNQSGYIQAHTPMHSVPPPPFMYDINCNNMHDENASGAVMMSPLPIMAKHGGSSGRRSTSVPRARMGAQKETLKQAAIRCGIIKGNHTVATIPKRSLGLAPLQLTPVQSDPVVSVVEIFHPKGTIPNCSSEDLVDFEEFKYKINATDSSGSEVFIVHNNKSTPALNIAMNVPGDDANHDSSRTTEKSNSEGQGQMLTESGPASITRTLENAVSCPTL